MEWGGGRLTAPTLPEVGPLLGRMTDVTRRFSDPAVGLDRIRLDLVSRVFDQAALARRLADGGDSDGAAAALGPAVWLRWWREAAAGAAEALMVAHRGRVLVAAARRRFPLQRATALLPDRAARAIVAARLEAAGIPLERLAGAGPAVSSLGETMRRWAVALDDAWDDLERLAARELGALAPAVLSIESWRPSLVPWLAVGTVVALALVWLALTIGGQVGRPAWLDPVASWFWRIPWP